MRNLVVKLSRKEKDYQEIDVYVRTSKRGFNLHTVVIWVDQVKGSYNANLGFQSRNSDTIHPGFMCLACGKPELSDIANGHILVEKPDLGLCGSCASTQEIFERFVTSDATGEYKLKSRD